MVVTDLDGTLFQSDRGRARATCGPWRSWAGRGRLRVIATGRNLFSARKVLPPDFPVDYLLFSSGAGVMDWPAQQPAALRVHERAGGGAGLPGPGRAEPGLHGAPADPGKPLLPVLSRRRARTPTSRRARAVYAAFASPGDRGDASQAKPASCWPWSLRSAGLRPTRSCAPSWPASRCCAPPRPWTAAPAGSRCSRPAASKSQAAAWLARERGVDPRRVLAVGNDYNDLDLLEWAAPRCLVAGSPPELAARFPVASSGDDSDFAEAVEAWERGGLRGGPAGRR